MYQYILNDKTMVQQRIAQFERQIERYQAGELTEDEFRPLRLLNGLYFQRHSYMLRVAIPYGLLSAVQLRMLAHIARTYDRGFGHFTTRQNIQFNWPKLEAIPQLLADLASVDMHTIQTSGSCIRNITTDHLAGVADDEIANPQVYCEIIRQWYTLHPDFSYLPRKLKIAVTGAVHDRAATCVHDIGLTLIRNADGQLGFRVLVGGGQGRTPMIGKLLCEFLPQEHLRSYLESIVRVFNRLGRRDDPNKARLKILVTTLGSEKFRELVEAEWQLLRDTNLRLDSDEIERMSRFFTAPPYQIDAIHATTLQARVADDLNFAAWVRCNVANHKVPGYRNVFISLKRPGSAPGDLNAQQMDALADLADRYSFGQLRTTRTQNLLLTDVHQGDLYELWQKLQELQLAAPTIGTLVDVICCPGLDYCSVASATSIDIAQHIQEKFSDLNHLYTLGTLQLNISGCMNACAHHHVGHIGILGIDKNGEQRYQIRLGGCPSNDATLSQALGPSIAKEAILDTLERILLVYVKQRELGERFLDTYRRLGIGSFRNK